MNALQAGIKDAVVETIAFTLFVALDGDSVPLTEERVKHLSSRWKGYLEEANSGVHACSLPEEMKISNWCTHCEVEKLFNKANTIYETKTD